MLVATRFFADSIYPKYAAFQALLQEDVPSKY